MYYRLSKLGRQWYAKRMSDIDTDEFQDLVDQGTPVLISDDLESAVDLLNIEASDVIIVGDE